MNKIFRSLVDIFTWKPTNSVLRGWKWRRKQLSVFDFSRQNHQNKIHFYPTSVQTTYLQYHCQQYSAQAYDELFFTSSTVISNAAYGHSMYQSMVNESTYDDINAGVE